MDYKADGSSDVVAYNFYDNLNPILDFYFDFKTYSRFPNGQVRGEVKNIAFIVGRDTEELDIARLTCNVKTIANDHAYTNTVLNVQFQRLIADNTIHTDDGSEILKEIYSVHNEANMEIVRRNSLLLFRVIMNFIYNNRRDSNFLIEIHYDSGELVFTVYQGDDHVMFPVSGFLLGEFEEEYKNKNENIKYNKTIFNRTPDRVHDSVDIKTGHLFDKNIYCLFFYNPFHKKTYIVYNFNQHFINKTNNKRLMKLDERLQFCKEKLALYEYMKEEIIESKKHKINFQLYHFSKIRLCLLWLYKHRKNETLFSFISYDVLKMICKYIV